MKGVMNEMFSGNPSARGRAQKPATSGPHRLGLLRHSSNIFRPYISLADCSVGVSVGCIAIRFICNQMQSHGQLVMKKFSGTGTNLTGPLHSGVTQQPCKLLHFSQHVTDTNLTGPLPAQWTRPPCRRWSSSNLSPHVCFMLYVNCYDVVLLHLVLRRHKLDQPPARAVG